MKIALVQPLTPSELTQLQNGLQLPFDDLTKIECSPTLLASYEIILGWHPMITDALTLDHHIKWIQLWMVGVDHLPLNALQQANVTVTTAKGANAKTIAQQTIGYLLMFARQLHFSRDMQNKNTWLQPTQLTELTGKRALSIGTGEIGQAFAQLAHAFEITVDGINRTGHSVDGFANCFSIKDLDNHLANYDYIVNSLPYTAETDKFLSTAQFAKMSPNTIFVNMGRGKSIDEAALIHALQTEQIAGAGLDVFETEPLPSNSPLWSMENVIITPHRAGISDYYSPRIIDIFLENFQLYRTNNTPNVNLLDYQKGY